MLSFGVIMTLFPRRSFMAYLRFWYGNNPRESYWGNQNVDFVQNPAGALAITSFGILFMLGGFALLHAALIGPFDWTH